MELGMGLERTVLSYQTVYEYTTYKEEWPLLIEYPKYFSRTDTELLLKLKHLYDFE